MTVKPDGVIKYGSASQNNSMIEAELNFPGAAFQPLSFCCSPIELLSNDGEDKVIRTGSAFFYQHEGISLLVTNWHVVSGRNLFTSSILSKHGYLPSKLRYYGVGLSQNGNHLTFSRSGWIITLPEAAQAMLAEPPVIDGVAVDIWAAPIPTHTMISKDLTRSGFYGANFISSHINDHVAQDIACRAGEDCLVLGYPLNNYDGLMPPIWKRASIASEPGLPVDGRPMFLIDGGTTASMSGSPVFRKIVVATAPDIRSGKLIEHARFQFLGVYAGRLQSKELEQTGLGYGWYGSLIGKVVKYYGYTKDSLQQGSLESLGFSSDGKMNN